MSLSVAVSLALLWAAVFALALLVFRTIGAATLKHHLFTVTILTLSLCAIPVGYLYKHIRGRTRQIASFLLPYHSQAIPESGSCQMFPQDNVWNAQVSQLAVDPHSASYIAAMGPDLALHPDFGSRDGYDYSVITGTAPLSNVTFTDSASESDPGPYRIPDDAPVEQGTDGHVLVFDQPLCTLYELFGARRLGSQRWQASSGAIFNLRSNQLRPAGWTSADAAGLAILPGLVRYDEINSGAIRHALRFTTPRTRKAYVWPARHRASQLDDPTLPAMGQRFRLKASFDLSRYSVETRAILTALRDYGMLLSDNGGPWFLSGTHDSRWPSKMVKELKTVHGGDFEAIDSSPLILIIDSGAISHN